MAHPNNTNLCSFPLSSLIFTNLSLLLFLLLLLPCTDALSFNFSSFQFNQTYITMQGAARFNGNSISLNNPMRDSVGRALYHKPMQLWEVSGSTKKLADFTSHFSFQISKSGRFNETGHGLAFVLVKEKDVLSPTSVGRLLGLFESENSGLSNDAANQVVAVEFDTVENKWDNNSQYHIGIDVNSLESKNYTNVPGGFIDKGIGNVWIVYNSTTRKLSASLTFNGISTSYDVSHGVDLSLVLPQRVQVGFTGATESLVETHDIYSWSFNSSLDDTPPTPPPPGGKKVVALAVGIALGLFVVILMSGVALYCRFRSKKVVARTPIVEVPLVLPPDDQRFHIDYPVPTRFTYLELSKATNNFDKELKLGEGGFGEVFEGMLPNSSDEKVAVKKFRKGSRQGEKEYVSEVNAISTLKHKGLVQFKGWCHENGNLILVYEFMFNRSLDFHLFDKRLPPLTWATRYKIVVDLASALHYLQDGCDPFVLHRDIKSSNIMLDSNFNAKLGDFGLARLTYQDQKFKTTIPAGTLGYLAPEVLSSQKVGKASDIYSFGVVALEIACGRRPVNQSREEDPSNVANLVKWVWELYGKGFIFEAVDDRLKGEFNHDQARRMMMVGLWCCHPDPEHRPSIRQVQAVLNFEATEPSLPPSIPKPTYVSSNTSMDMTEAGSSTRASHTTSSNTISST